MIARFLLIAGIAGSPLVAASPAMTQTLPLGSVMNAVRSAQPAPQPRGQAQQPPAQGSKATQPGGAAVKSRPKAGTFYLMRSKNRRLYGGRSEDNG
jgi:hypothetical protein